MPWWWVSALGALGRWAGLGWQWHHPVWHPQLPSSLGGSELLSSISFHLRKAQVSRVFQVHMTLWARKTSQTMQSVWDDAGGCKVPLKREEMTRAMAEGRWHYRDNWAFAHRHIFVQAVESPISTLMFMVQTDPKWILDGESWNKHISQNLFFNSSANFSFFCVQFASYSAWIQFLSMKWLALLQAHAFVYISISGVLGPEHICYCKMTPVFFLEKLTGSLITCWF